MLLTSWPLFIFLTALGHVLANSVQAPTVTLDSATVAGFTSGSTNQFLGIPFAQPPIGNLRFRLPRALPPYDSSFSATAFGHSCPQQAFFPMPSALPAQIIAGMNVSVRQTSSEDCLTLNVVTPTSATFDSKLPVMVWIHGGAFEVGAAGTYDGSVIVGKAVSLGIPAIFVSINYRLNALGFLASQEVKDAGVGNLGLHDQRLALRWVQKYISAFGGDPTKVTIWGQSAGAMSVALQMVTNGGNAEGLFRGAFMQSGAPIFVGDITNGQRYYDTLVEDTECSGAEDTLQCLREVPYQTLMDAVNKSPHAFSYQSVVLAWMPRVDGVFLTANPAELVRQDSVANVPFVTGTCDDEGTLFSFSTVNITTDAEFEEYIYTYWFPNASDATIAELMGHYPSDTRSAPLLAHSPLEPTQESPFDMGHRSAPSPQFNRLAGFQGDAIFQAPRRLFLQHRSGKQPVWTYTNERFKNVPILGSFHGTDIRDVFTGGDIAAYLVRFVTNLDPNIGDGEGLFWPEYRYSEDGNETMLAFVDGPQGQTLTIDRSRVDAVAFLTDLLLQSPI